MADVTTSSRRSAPASPAVHALAAGAMRATVRPRDGGRVASLWRKDAEALWEGDADGCGREPRPLAEGARRHDSCHDERETTRYHAGWDGTASIERRGGRRIVIEAGPRSTISCSTPAGGGYLCREPVSHVADAFNLAAAGKTRTGARVLEPGEAIRATVRITLS